MGGAIRIGPQIGFIITISKEYQGYLNISGYKDVEVAISPAPPEQATAKPLTRNY